MTKLLLSIFPTRNKVGYELAHQITTLAESAGYEVRSYYDATSMQYLSAVGESDATILDATIERRGEHNYHFALPLADKRILVISRSYLPLNFYGPRDRIISEQQSSDGKIMRRELSGTPLYPGTHSNRDILTWVALQLEALKNPRVSPHGDQIFISYRNTKNYKTGEETHKGIQQLIPTIEVGKFHNSNPKTVRYFPPRSLSAELMTEIRRWQLLSWIDRFIGDAEEVWIYETDDYYNSWWTLAELTTWLYRGSSGPTDSTPRLRIFNPHTQKLCNAPHDFLPALNKQQINRIARWYVNADTRQMAPESFVALHLLSQLPLVGKLPYLRDPVYSRQFWMDPVFDCPRCRVLGKNRNRFNLDDFLWTKGPNFFRIPAEQMPYLLEEQHLTCPRCASLFKFGLAAPQYLWMPVVNDHATGEYLLKILGLPPREPGEHHLIELPNYEFKV